MNVLITCFKNETTKDFEFQFQGQRKKAFFLNTLTMNMIIDILKKAMESIDTIDETPNKETNKE